MNSFQSGVALGSAMLLVACALVAREPASATPRPSPVTVPSFQIWVTPKSQRLGDYRIRRNPSYQGAIDVFGEPDQCRTVRGRGGVAVWRSLGFRLYATTLGYPGPNATACNSPAEHWINHITVTGRQWQTRSGLRVGHSLATLLRMYPKARRHRGWQAGYWLVAAREHCIGICETEFVSVPRLVARINGGRVRAFVIPVHAQGE